MPTVRGKEEPGLSLAKPHRPREMPESSSKDRALVKTTKMNVRAFETMF